MVFDMICNKKTAAIIRSTYHPVVKQYMDIIKLAFVSAGFHVVDVSLKEKINRNTVVVTDSPLVAIKYLFKGIKNNYVWYQGVAPEESFVNNHSKLRFILLSFVEKKVMKKAKFLFFVSDEMKRFYERKYKLNLDDKSFIMPCFNEKEVVESVFSDDKYSQNNFVYLGGLQLWQCFEQTVSIYSVIERRSEKPTKLYVFSANKDQVVAILKKYGVKNYEVDFVSPQELSSRIKNVKYGFVLREDNSVNNVATPTKFSNYLSNGIIPIYSNAVKSFAEYDSKLNLGVICNLNNVEEGVENILSHMEKNITAAEIKEKCHTVFSDYYNYQMYVDKIANKIKAINL